MFGRSRTRKAVRWLLERSGQQKAQHRTRAGIERMWGNLPVIALTELGPGDCVDAY